MKNWHCVLIWVITLSCSLLAQTAPPLNVKLRMNFEPEYEPMAELGWNENQPGIDHFEVFFDGAEIMDPFFGEFWNYGIAYFNSETVHNAVTQNEYHEIGIIAVDTNGVASDTIVHRFYFSETAYSRPGELTIVNNLDSGSALFTWDEPTFGGGQDQPTVISYNIYLNSAFIANTSQQQYTFMNLIKGTNYVAGVTTNYSDGYSDSTIYPNYSKKEFFFDTLATPINLAIDESSGLFSWEEPYRGNEIIGGTYIGYPWGVGWECAWFSPEEYYTTFGNNEHFVNTRWALWSWSHNSPKEDDQEGLYFQNWGTVSFNYALADVMNIRDIVDAENLNYATGINVLDATTNQSGIGGFVVHYNADNGSYGVLRIDDVYNPVENPVCTVIGLVDFTWWLQTNGTGDFSGAPDYYPESYNIYLDGSYITSTSSLEYQFNNLESGQTYTAGIEAVYHVGKSRMVTKDFVSNVLGVNDNQIPLQFALNQNYPNPFNPTTKINFSIPKSLSVNLKVYDMLGNEITTLVNKEITSGYYEVEFDASHLSSGIYFYKLQAGNFIETKKMILLR